MDAQLKRGLLEICVLSALRQEDSYGYRIIKDLSPLVTISESTLYPILKRLESGGSLYTYSMAHNGRLRKYYRITDLGLRKIRQFLMDWRELQRMYQWIEQKAERKEEGEA